MKAFWDDMNEVLQTEVWKKEVQKRNERDGGWKYVKGKKGEIENIWAIFKKEMKIISEDIGFMQWKEFLRVIGIKDSDAAEKVFRLCKFTLNNAYDDEDDSHKGCRINIRAFIYNFNRYQKYHYSLREKTKIF